VSRLAIEGVSRVFPGVRRGAPTRALEPTTLTVADNDFVTILGPSGCGKSTLLRLIAGLDQPTIGQILLDGKAVSAPGADRGMVFQSYTLFPWLTVGDNIAFGLREKGVAWEQREKIVRDWLGRIGLAGFEHHYPKQLSGGMQQRTAIVRALVQDPRLLLMDEPFGALDAMTREQMNLELLRIWSKSDKTVIFITHSIAEAIFLSDRVIAMTARPGTIADVITINLPRPRELSVINTDRFGRYAAKLRSLLDAKEGMF
jgi:ABC-type nitrate/sulfonate/bicarbonate transport system ATPase subunit